MCWRRTDFTGFTFRFPSNLSAGVVGIVDHSIYFSKMKKIILTLLGIVAVISITVLVLIQTNQLEITVSNWENIEDYPVQTNSIDSILKKYPMIRRSNNRNGLFLNFWELGCGHCFREIPRLNKIYHESREQNINFYAIASCSEEKGMKSLKASNLDFDFPKVFEVSGLRIRLKVNIEKKAKVIDSVPVTIILGPNNEVLLYKRGEISETQVDSIIRLIKSI